MKFSSDNVSFWWIPANFLTLNAIPPKKAQSFLCSQEFRARLPAAAHNLCRNVSVTFPRRERHARLPKRCGTTYVERKAYVQKILVPSCRDICKPEPGKNIKYEKECASFEQAKTQCVKSVLFNIDWLLAYYNLTSYCKDSSFKWFRKICRQLLLISSNLQHVGIPKPVTNW